MGGLVFANVKTKNGEPPNVPRMSPETYHAVAAKCQSRLLAMFERVIIPRDAPAKKDFGDVDFLAEGIKPPHTNTSIWPILSEILNAKYYINRGSSHSYAVPHPEIQDAFTQVDVELSPGDGTPDAAKLFEWTRFMKSDSDLLQIVGVSHRPLGLTCNDRGLHVRVAEIEPYDKKKALLFLTRDPNQAMRFYGYNVNKYWEGFLHENDLFDWATSGRFFSQEILDARVEKANDRQRQKKRPMYMRFLKEYQRPQSDRVWTRQEVLHQALTFFGKQSEYSAMMTEHRCKEAEERFWHDVRATIPLQGTPLSHALKGLRRVVYFKGGRPFIVQEAPTEYQARWPDLNQLESETDIVAWIKENWQEVKSLEKKRANTAKGAKNL